MIHGFGTGGWVWDGYRPIFERHGFRCLCPDLPYHGHLQEPPPPQLGRMSIADYTVYLEGIINDLGETPSVIAHSGGTLLAQVLAARGLAKAVVLLAPIPPAGIYALNKDALKTVGSVLRTWRFWRKPVRPTFEEVVFGALHRSTPDEQHRVYERFGYESGRAILEIASWCFVRRSPIAVDETKVTCPILVAAGSDDRTTPPLVSRKIAAKYNAEYREFKNHAHWPLGEPGWEKIAESCAEWLVGAGAGDTRGRWSGVLRHPAQ